MVYAVDTRSHAPPEERPDEGKKSVYCAAASAAASGTLGPAAVCVAGHAAGHSTGSAGEGDDELLSWKQELERVPLLSAREAEVFGLLGEGYSNRSIARELDITERTAKFHVARVLSKLRVESRLQAGLVAHSFRRLYQGAVPRRVDTR
ncbi:helix-turn-helix transcriptional regulator [Streptomyces sp. NPDC024017]|uniref:helix-turn-helix transcriptional regulator n=1 Tax=Streptomyces sp. NPDC024017 TaxID=3154326 RepID=UPI0033F6C152